MAYPIQTYSIFWKYGKKELISGDGFVDSLRLACYNFTHIENIDFWKQGDCLLDFQFDIDKREWEQKSSDEQEMGVLNSLGYDVSKMGSDL